MWRGLALALSLVFGFSVAGETAKLPLPEYFGVYAVAGGKLVELKRNAFGPSRTGMPIGGADLMRSVSSISFENGDIQLLFYSASTPSVSGVARIARVAKEVTQEAFNTSSVRPGEGKDVDLWYLTDRGYELRFAPVPGGDARMLRGVPRGPLPPGVYAVTVNGNLFDFKVGPNAEASAPCLVRVAHFTGVEYQPCPEGVGTWGESPEVIAEGSTGGGVVSESVRYVNPADDEEYLELHPNGRFQWQRRACTIKRSGGTMLPCGGEAVHRWRHLGNWWGDYKIEGDQITCVISARSASSSDGHTWVGRIRGDRIIESSGTTWKKK